MKREKFHTTSQSSALLPSLPLRTIALCKMFFGSRLSSARAAAKGKRDCMFATKVPVKLGQDKLLYLVQLLHDLLWEVVPGELEEILDIA